MDDGARCDFLAENRYGFPFTAHHIGECPTGPLPSYRDNPPVGIAISGRPTIHPLRELVFLAGGCAEVSAIDLHNPE